MKISWTNKFSGEQGFVESVNADSKDFKNTTNLEDAADYSPKAAEKYIAALNENQSQNTYSIIETSKPVSKPSGRKQSSGPKKTSEVKKPISKKEQNTKLKVFSEKKPVPKIAGEIELKSPIPVHSVPSEKKPKPEREKKDNKK